MAEKGAAELRLKQESAAIKKATLTAAMSRLLFSVNKSRPSSLLVSDCDNQKETRSRRMEQFTGLETFYHHGLAGDILFTEGVK